MLTCACDRARAASVMFVRCSCPALPASCTMNLSPTRRRAGRVRRGLDSPTAPGCRAPCRQLVERQTGIEKRAEHHVARDAREAVEIQHARTPDPPHLLEAAVPRVAEHDVVHHLDAHQRRPPPRSRRVSSTSSGLGVGIARGMVVKHDDGRRAAERRFAKHFARLTTVRVQRADRQHRRPQHAMLGVEQHDAELLDRRASRTCGSRIRRRIARRAQSEPRARRVRRASGGRVRGRPATCAARAAPMPAIRARSSHVDRASREARRARRSTRWRRASASPRREPLPSTSATSSLSPSAAAPCRSSFSRGRSSGDRSFIVLQPRSGTRILSERCRLRASCCRRLVRRCVAASRRLRRRSSRQRNATGAGRDRRGARGRRRPVRTRRVRGRQDGAQATRTRRSTQRDYRLALNHALDSRERAQNAAKQAADGKAAARAEADRASRPRRRAINAVAGAREGGRSRTSRPDDSTPRAASTRHEAGCKKRAQPSITATTRASPTKARSATGFAGSGRPRSRRGGRSGGSPPPLTRRRSFVAVRREHADPTVGELASRLSRRVTDSTRRVRSAAAATRLRTAPRPTRSGRRRRRATRRAATRPAR